MSCMYIIYIYINMYIYIYNNCFAWGKTPGVDFFFGVFGPLRKLVHSIVDLRRVHLNSGISGRGDFGLENQNFQVPC